MIPEIYDATAATTIAGWLQALKRVIPCPPWIWKMTPLFAIALGVVYAFAYRPQQDNRATFMYGIGVGFGSSGLFSGAKAAREAIAKIRKGKPVAPPPSAPTPHP